MRPEGSDASKRHGSVGVRVGALLLGLLTAGASGGGASALTQTKSKQRTGASMKVEIDVSKFTRAPLRNRLRVQLDASTEEVWSLVGDPARLPEYSAGLERVEAKRDSSGTCTEYVCHFKPRGEDGERRVHRERIRWYEPKHGYASSGEAGNAFGLTNDPNLVTAQPSRDGTLLTWDEYFEAQDLDMRRTEYGQAFADIAERLIARFGGRVVERYVDGSR